MSMKQLLDAMIDESDNGMVPGVQISFKPGVTATAGTLKHHEDVEGVYCLGTATRANEGTPGATPGELVTVESMFTADAVQSVVRMMAASPIVTS